MKRIEPLLAALVVIGLLMKFFLVPGGTEIMVISLIVLACMYYPVGFFYFNSIGISKIFKRESYSGLSVFQGMGAFVGGLIFSILLVGILFKLIQLPGSRPMLITGLVAGGPFLLIIIIVKYFFSTRESSFYRNMIIRSIVIVGISGILYVTPGLVLVKIFYRSHPDYIQAYEQASNNPNDEELQRKAEVVREKMND